MEMERELEGAGGGKGERGWRRRGERKRKREERKGGEGVLKYGIGRTKKESMYIPSRKNSCSILIAK
jgi:hypothetical protein